MSGHSKWSTIKRKKGAIDAKRSKIFTKIVKEITIAARMGGGDPNANPRLRRAVDLAKASNFPGDNIARAIKKGTGELEGVNYEDIIYEGVGPGGALFLLEVTTDNRNRTAAEVRTAFSKHDGSLGASGSSAWAFEQKGIIKIPLDAATEEQLFEIALTAGAEDIAQDETWVVSTPREMLDAVATAIEKEDIIVSSALLEYIPTQPKVVGGDDAVKLMSLYEALDEHDDIQNVFTDFEPDEATLAAL